MPKFENQGTTTSILGPRRNLRSPAVVGPAGAVAVGPVTVTVVHDTFTAGDGTAIAGRTSSPVAGAGLWANKKFAATIVSNKMAAAAGGGQDTETVIDAGAANVTVSATVARGPDYVGLSIRHTGTAGSNEYLYLANATDWAAGKAGSGGSGTYASGNGTFTQGLAVDLKVVLLGTNFKGYINSILVCDFTTSSGYEANTLFGVLAYPGSTIDDFKVTVPG